MPRRLPPYVEKNIVKGKTYLYFRKDRGKRTRLPADPTSNEFKRLYADCLAGIVKEPKAAEIHPQNLGALIASYKASPLYLKLGPVTKRSYSTPLEILREKHWHRTVTDEKMDADKIEKAILASYSDRPGQQRSILKILRILIRHAMKKKNPWLTRDPSIGIKRPEISEIRAWTDAEMEAYERRWSLGTTQRTAYELMLNVGVARADVHAIKWGQLVEGGAQYARSKTGVQVDIPQSDRLMEALAAWPRKHAVVLYTSFGKSFTVAGFGNFMRDAIRSAGLPLECKPHGLRKTLGRRMADAGVTAHDIMAHLGHRSLAEAERYTREANRRKGGKRSVAALNKLDVVSKRKGAQTTNVGLGKSEIGKGK